MKLKVILLVSKKEKIAKKSFLTANKSHHEEFRLPMIE